MGRSPASSRTQIDFSHIPMFFHHLSHDKLKLFVVGSARELWKTGTPGVYSVYLVFSGFWLKLQRKFWPQKSFQRSYPRWTFPSPKWWNTSLVPKHVDISYEKPWFRLGGVKNIRGMGVFSPLWDIFSLLCEAYGNILKVVAGMKLVTIIKCIPGWYSWEFPIASPTGDIPDITVVFSVVKNATS